MRKLLKVVIFIFFFLYPTKSWVIEVLLNKDYFYPGDTLSLKVVSSSRTETIGMIKCFWNGNEYPTFPVGEGTVRTLLAIPGNFPPGKHEIVVSLPQELEKKYPVEIKAKKFPEERVTFSPEKMKLLTLPENKEQQEFILKTLKVYSEKQNWQGKFIFPTIGKISSPYGVRRSTENFHKGVDISTKIYTSVFSPNAGMVILATHFNLPGNFIIIDHGQGVMTVYYHLSSLAVKSGQLVQKGDKIGEVGDSGLANASHLHWGLYIYGEAVDPLVWLKEKF